jgi:hypothetical protein
MIKFAAAGLWLCAVTVGAVFLSFQMSGASQNGEATPPLLGGLDYVGTPIISVPVLTKDGIVGYLLTKLVYTTEPSKLRKLSVPAEALFTDQLYSYLFSNPSMDFTQVKTLDLDALRNGIRDSINKRVGDELIHEVMIEQMDFLSKDEIRDNAMTRRRANPTAKVPTLGKEEPAQEPAH